MRASVFLAADGQRSWLGRLDPRVKLAWLAWVSTLAVTVDSALGLLLLALLAACVAANLRLQPRSWAVVAGLLAAIVWGTMLSQGLFYQGLPRTRLVTLVPAGQWGGWSFTGLVFYREGALYGLLQSLRMLAVVLTGLAVCLSTGPERLLAAFSRLRVPVAVSFMTVAALRFLPLLLTELAIVRQARWLRGYRARWWPPRAGAWTEMLRSEFAILIPVLAACLRRATALSTSIVSRGFDPLARRTFFPPLRLRPGELTTLVALAGSWLWLVGAKTLYWLYLADLYYRPGLRPLYDWVRRWL